MYAVLLKYLPASSTVKVGRVAMSVQTTFSFSNSLQ